MRRTRSLLEAGLRAACWVGLLGGVALGVRAAPVAADAQGDALAALVKALPAETVPLRVSVSLDLPALPSQKGADPRPARLARVVGALLWAAGFLEVEASKAADSPSFVLELRGTESVEKEGGGAPGGAGGVDRSPRLVARVSGRLTLSKAGGPAWSAQIGAAASVSLGTGEAALRIRAPYESAIAESNLLALLLDLVAARQRSVPGALVHAYDAAVGRWEELVFLALDLYEPGALARGFLPFLDDEDRGVGDLAADLMVLLGAPALEPLLSSPAEGSLTYRLRRLSALQDLSIDEEPDPRVATQLRAVLNDPSALLRSVGLRGLAAVEGERVAAELVAATRDPQPCVAGHARLLLEGLSKRKGGKDPASWDAWLREAQTRGVKPASAPATRALLFPFGVRVPKSDAKKPGNDPVAPYLARLAALQRRDGSWPVSDAGFAYFEPGVSALALLAFLVAGHSPASEGAYALCVRRAVDYLQAQQALRAGPTHGYIGENLRWTEAGHAFATLALLQAWAEAPTPALHARIVAALNWIYVARNPYFAWRYGAKPGDNDTFLSLCMVLPIFAAAAANRAAEEAGLAPPFPVDEEVFDGLKAWMDKMTDPDYGYVGYVRRGQAHPGYKQAAVADAPRDVYMPLVLEAGVAHARLRRATPQKGGRPASEPMAAKALELVGKRAPHWPAESRSLDMLEWWWGGMAFALAPSDASGAKERAKRYEQEVRAVLGGAVPLAQLVEADRWGQIGGEAYVAAMAVLSLLPRELLPVLESGRPDLGRVVSDPKAAAERRARALTAWMGPGKDKASAVALTWLTNSDRVLRGAAARALAGRSALAEGQVVGLGKAFPRMADDVRASVVELWGNLASTSPGARAGLLAALGDASPPVRAVALDAWPAAQPLPPGQRDAVVALLREGDARVVRAALRALLREVTKPTLAELEPVCTHADPLVRQEALAAVAGLSAALAERVAPLVRALSDVVPSVRAEVVRGLGRLAGPAEVEPLRKLLGDADAGVGQEVVLAWAAVVGRFPPLLETLVLALAAPEPLVRRRAAEVFTRLGPSVKHVQPRLHEAIKAEVGRGLQRDAHVLLALAEARWSVTAEAPAVAGILKGVLTDEDVTTDVAVRAVELMGRIPEASDDTSTERLLHQSSGRGVLGLAVLNAIADMGARGRHFREWLMELVDDYDPGDDWHDFAEVALRRVDDR